MKKKLELYRHTYGVRGFDPWEEWYFSLDEAVRMAEEGWDRLPISTKKIGSSRVEKCVFVVEITDDMIELVNASETDSASDILKKLYCTKFCAKPVIYNIKCGDLIVDGYTRYKIATGDFEAEAEVWNSDDYESTKRREVNR